MFLFKIEEQLALVYGHLIGVLASNCGVALCISMSVWGAWFLHTLCNVFRFKPLLWPAFWGLDNHLCPLGTRTGLSDLFEDWVNFLILKTVFHPFNRESLLCLVMCSDSKVQRGLSGKFNLLGNVLEIKSSTEVDQKYI